MMKDFLNNVCVVIVIGILLVCCLITGKDIFCHDKPFEDDYEAAVHWD